MRRRDTEEEEVEKFIECAIIKWSNSYARQAFVSCCFVRICGCPFRMLIRQEDDDEEGNVNFYCKFSDLFVVAAVAVIRRV